MVGLLAALLAGCGSSSSDGSSSGGPSIVVTTSVLGDVVDNLVGDQAEVEVLMPRGADPHEASLSSRQADEMTRADLVVVNGAGFEQNMIDVIDSVEDDGTPVLRVAEEVDLLTFAEQHAAQDAEDDEHAAEDAETETDEHAAEDAETETDEHAAEDEHGHDEDELDPHFWTDPTLMAEGTRALADRLAEVDGIDTAALDEAEARYLDHLDALDDEVTELLGPIPEDARVLVTNHEVFGYFAGRYGFRVVGTVVPAGTTQAEPSSSDITELAEVVRDTGVPAIFADTSSPARLADALADEVGDVEVVELYSESLGEPGSGGATYLQMMRANAERIAEALA